MAVLGWMVIVLVACWLSVGTFALSMWSGLANSEGTVMLTLTSFFWWLVWWCSPFTVTLN